MDLFAAHPFAAHRGFISPAQVFPAFSGTEGRPQAPLEAFVVLVIALGLGLLVGMQRERQPSSIAGIRTFAIIALLGAMCGLMTPAVGGWLIPAGVIAIAGTLGVANFLRATEDRTHFGTTTEFAAMAMFLVGAWLAFGPRAAAVAVGAAVAILLHAKPTLHGVVKRLGDRDVRAIMQFALITFIVLPVLPNRTFDALDALNPYRVWLMVVLVTGLSLVGYIAYRFVGRNAGAAVSGVLGGLVSSTATTVSAGRLAARSPSAVPAAARIITIACAIMYVRVLVVSAAVAPGFAAKAAGPLLVMLAAAVVSVAAAWVWTGSNHERRDADEHGNPSELGAALLFAGIYAVVLLAAKAARRYVGEAALYPVAAFAGLTDADAITLSTAEMASSGGISAETGRQVLVVALMSNTLAKTAVAGFMGGRPLLARVGPLLAIQLIAGAVVLAAWPASR